MRATEIGLRTDARENLVDLTGDLRERIVEQGWREGLLHVRAPHTTAGVCINENADPDVARDILDTLGRLVPREGAYAHGEGNSDAHIKSVLLGNSVTIPVVEGRLQLGRWEGIFFCEFDGPRDRIVRLYFVED